MVPKMNLIVAVCEPNMGIGNKGQLPWRLSKEMDNFRQKTTETEDLTKQNAVLMGRKCWESIPSKFKPLKDRINIVLSRTLVEPPMEGVYICNSMEKVYEILNNLPQIESVWNIGGRDIYDLGLKSEFCHRIYMTKIENEFQCDTFFSEIDWQKFKEVTENQEIQEEKGIRYKFCIFEKNE